MIFTGVLRAMPCHAMPCQGDSSYAQSVTCRALAMLCRAEAVPCHGRAVPYRAKMSRASFWRAVPCRLAKVPCHAVPCRAMPCQAGMYFRHVDSACLSGLSKAMKWALLEELPMVASGWIPLISMDLYGFLLFFMDFHRFPWIRGIRWDPNRPTGCKRTAR